MCVVLVLEQGMLAGASFMDVLLASSFESESALVLAYSSVALTLVRLFTFVALYVTRLSMKPPR